MPSESQQRGTRAKKEAYLLELVQGEGKIRVTDLYGSFSRRYPGASIRTFLSEYLPALEYRLDIVLHVNAHGYYAYEPQTFQKEQAKTK